LKTPEDILNGGLKVVTSSIIFWGCCEIMFWPVV
jgi:hypothetical protein